MLIHEVEINVIHFFHLFLAMLGFLNMAELRHVLVVFMYFQVWLQLEIQILRLLKLHTLLWFKNSSLKIQLQQGKFFIR